MIAKYFLQLQIFATQKLSEIFQPATNWIYNI